MEPFPVYIKPEHLPATIVEILCESGSLIDASDRLLKYEYLRPFREERKDDVLVAGAILSYKKSYDYLYSKLDGQVDDILVEVGDRVESSTKPIITTLVPCNHSRTILSDYCADCGDYWPSSEFVAFSHNEAGIKISLQEADRIARETKDRLIESRKLIMILDLDLTIIHATVEPHIGVWMKDEQNINYPATKDICTFTLPDKDIVYYIKPRTGLVKFLETMHELYELHVYTMGTRPYAEAVTKAIDPTRKYFSGRILSRDENGSHSKKDIKRLFPTDSSMVVVLDDRPEVWGWSPNLIKVWPFSFFDIGDINGDLHKKSTNLLTENGGGSEAPILKDNDKELIRLHGVLAEIHKRFYRQYDHHLDELTRFMSSNDIPFPSPPDVTEVLTKLKTDVLSGVKLFFAGIFPKEVDPRSAELWIWAETFGAHCLLKSGRELTHVVASDPRHPDVRAALGLPGVRILTLRWLYDSLVYWHRQDEKEYLLKGLPAPPKLRVEDLAESAFTPTPPCNGDAALESLEPGLSDLRDDSALEEDPTEAEDMDDDDMDELEQNNLNAIFDSDKWSQSKKDIDAELAEMGISEGESEFALEDLPEETIRPKRSRSPSAISAAPPPKILVTDKSYDAVPEPYLKDLEALSNEHSDQGEQSTKDWDDVFNQSSDEQANSDSSNAPHKSGASSSSSSGSSSGSSSDSDSDNRSSN